MGNVLDVLADMDRRDGPAVELDEAEREVRPVLRFILEGVDVGVVSADGVVADALHGARLIEDQGHEGFRCFGHDLYSPL